MCYYLFPSLILLVIFPFFEKSLFRLLFFFYFSSSSSPFPPCLGSNLVKQRNKNLFKIHFPITSGKKIFYIFTAK